jgi:hypothetical protein
VVVRSGTNKQLILQSGTGNAAITIDSSNVVHIPSLASTGTLSGTLPYASVTGAPTSLSQFTNNLTSFTGNVTVGNFVAGNIIAGNAFMGLYTAGSGTCSVGNTQVTAPNYGFMQNTFGATSINFAAGQSILFQTGAGTNFMQIGPSTITVNQPAVMMQGCNVGTGTAAGAGNLTVAASLTAKMVGINSSPNSLYQLYVNGIANATTAVYGGNLLVGVLSGTLNAVISNLGAPLTGWGFYQNSSGATTINAAVGQAVNINNGGNTTIATFSTLSAAFNVPVMSITGNLSVAGTITANISSNGLTIGPYGLTYLALASTINAWAITQNYLGSTSINSAAGQSTYIYCGGTNLLVWISPTQTVFETPVMFAQYANVGTSTTVGNGNLGVAGSINCGDFSTQNLGGSITCAGNISAGGNYFNSLKGGLTIGPLVGFSSGSLSNAGGIINSALAITGGTNTYAVAQLTNGQTLINAPTGQTIQMLIGGTAVAQFSATGFTGFSAGSTGPAINSFPVFLSLIGTPQFFAYPYTGISLSSGSVTGYPYYVYIPTVGGTTRNWPPSYANSTRLTIPYTGLYSFHFLMDGGIITTTATMMFITKNMNNGNDATAQASENTISIGMINEYPNSTCGQANCTAGDFINYGFYVYNGTVSTNNWSFTATLLQRTA